MLLLSTPVAGWAPRAAAWAHAPRVLLSGCAPGRFDRTAFDRSVTVVGVSVAAAQCAAALEQLRPHLLRRRGVRPVREEADSGRRVLLLDHEPGRSGPVPSALQREIESLGGTLRECRVDITYAQLDAQEVLRELLPAGVDVPGSFETVGHLVHLNLRDEQRPYRELIGQVLLDDIPMISR